MLAAPAPASDRPGVASAAVPAAAALGPNTITRIGVAGSTESAARWMSARAGSIFAATAGLGGAGASAGGGAGCEGGAGVGSSPGGAGFDGSGTCLGGSDGAGDAGGSGTGAGPGEVWGGVGVVVVPEGGEDESSSPSPSFGGLVSFGVGDSSLLWLTA